MNLTILNHRSGLQTIAQSWRASLLVCFLFFGLMFPLSAQTNSSSNNLSEYVNPFVGTGGHGHTFPGAASPFGMVQLSPDTRIDDSWDGCGGYHYDDSFIYGFSHTHLNGTGVSDYGDILLMPTMGEPSFDNKIYASTFSHANEKASAGFYSVKLDKHNIDVRLTTSTRVGFHEYTFNNAGQANIILDLNHRDKLLYGEVRIVNPTTIEILRRSEAWARDQYVYARIEFNVPLKVNLVKEKNKENTKLEGIFKGTELALSFYKQVKKGEKILVKVSLSPTSYEGAKLNSSEIKHWDFEKVKQDAETLWNKELSKIEVTSDDKDKLVIFYTALYHTMMQPNIAQDIDGKYRGRDNQIHTAEGFDYYTVFSLWDTFRGAHPLYTLIDKKRTSDFINTFIKQYEQGGRLPVWELASNETDCMIGYHSVSVIADAMAKGITGFDYEKAFEASKASAMRDVLGLEAYKKNGFISMDDEHESVSKTLEYAYDDWCIAQMAQILNKKEDYQYFMKRSQNWKNIFDWETSFMRPKKNGGWDKPFDPREVNNNFTEGNSWQYSFFVPQDISGMIQAYGGPEKFEAKLDALFNAESKTTGREQVDVTGLIGQYAHGNEPSHHMAYLYNFVNKPYKTQEKVRQILTELYKNDPDGVSGNEDCGQMSAWYVLSAMGFYPVTPASNDYIIGKPLFKKATIHLENGKQFVISAKNLSDKNIYIESVEVCAIKDPMPADGPCVFTGKSAIYYGNEEYFDDHIDIKPNCSYEKFCLFLKAFDRFKEDIEYTIMLLEELPINGIFDSHLTRITDEVEYLVSRVVQGYEYMNSYYSYKLLRYFPDEIKDIIRLYFDEMFCHDTSFYEYYLTLTEDICYYGNMNNQSDICISYMRRKKYSESIFSSPTQSLIDKLEFYNYSKFSLVLIQIII